METGWALGCNSVFISMKNAVLIFKRWWALGGDWVGIGLRTGFHFAEKWWWALGGTVVGTGWALVCDPVFISMKNAVLNGGTVVGSGWRLGEHWVVIGFSFQ